MADRVQPRAALTLIALGRGQALGLHVTGMKAMQAVGATLAGLTAQYLPAGTAMTVMAVASLAVTAALSPGLRRPNPAQQLPAEASRLSYRGPRRIRTG